MGSWFDTIFSNAYMKINQKGGALMSKWNPIAKIKECDKSTLGKWACLIGAGLLGLIANIFDTRHKDRLYESKLGEKVDEQIQKLKEKEAA